MSIPTTRLGKFQLDVKETNTQATVRKSGSFCSAGCQRMAVFNTHYLNGSDVPDVASFLHDEYEMHAADVGWETQVDVEEWEELPEDNQQVMKRLAETLLDKYSLVPKEAGLEETPQR